MDNKRVIKRLVFIGIPVIILALLAGGVWWLFSSGHLVYYNTINNSSSTSSSQPTVVCGTDVVNKYNNITYSDVGSNIDNNVLLDFAKEIRGIKSYQQDPTCQTILFLLAIYDNNVDQAKTAFEATRDMYIEGYYANSNIRNVQPIFMMEQITSAMADESSIGG